MVFSKTNICFYLIYLAMFRKIFEFEYFEQCGTIESMG